VTSLDDDVLARRLREALRAVATSPIDPGQMPEMVQGVRPRVARAVTPVVVAAAVLVVFFVPVPHVSLFESLTNTTKVATPTRQPVRCESRWLRLSTWPASPSPAAGQHPPTTVREIVRVDSSGHTCTLPAGWLRLTSVRRQGTPFAAVEQADVGQSRSVALSPGGFAVARVALRVPWLIPFGNLCASFTTIGMTPPGSRHNFSTGVPFAGCGDKSAGVLRATVSPFRPIDSGVPHASGTLVADLQPGPMALGPRGVLYISEPSLNQVVARLPNGSFKLIAGTGRAGYSGDGGPALRAMLHQPEGLAVGPDGNLYIADLRNNRVREVLSNGTIVTVAGNGGKMPETVPMDGLPNGPALRTHLWSPSAVTIGRGGALYIAAMNENAIVELKHGRITTVVTAHDLQALNRVDRTEVCDPTGVAFDKHGDLYFDCNSALLMLTPVGSVVFRGNWESSGFSSMCAAGGDEVAEMTTSGVVSLTPTSQRTERLPSVLPSIGILSPDGIAAGSDGTIYVDGGGPPAIFALSEGRVTTLWAADT